MWNFQIYGLVHCSLENNLWYREKVCNYFFPLPIFLRNQRFYGIILHQKQIKNRLNKQFNHPIPPTLMRRFTGYINGRKQQDHHH